MIIAYNLCYSTIIGKFDPKTGGTSGNLGVLPYSEANTSAALAQAARTHESWRQTRKKRRDRSSVSSPMSYSNSDSNSNLGSNSFPASTLSPSSQGMGGIRSPIVTRFPNSSRGGASSWTPPNTAQGEEANIRTPSKHLPGTASPGGYQDGWTGDGSPRGFTHSPMGDPSTPVGPGGARRVETGWNPASVHVAPNTAGFCHPSMRQGILPVMLREILETRVMIKGAMRRAEAAKQRVLARTLNARQFALKMISNVTYG